MTLLTYNEDQLVGGLNQQPEFLRPEGTLVAQVDYASSFLDGLTKRHPVDHLATVDTTVSGPRAFHVIDRDSNERYALSIAQAHPTFVNLRTMDIVPIFNQAGASELAFTYLRAIHAQLITLQTAEDLSSNAGTTQEDPASGAPATNVSWKSWKLTGTPATSYFATSTTNYGAPGPLGGTVGTQMLRVTKTSNGGLYNLTESAIFYYHFIQSMEDGSKRKFAPLGVWNVWSIYIDPNQINQAQSIGLGFLDASTATHLYAKWAIAAGAVLNTSPVFQSTGITSLATKLRSGRYRLEVYYRSVANDPNDQRRPTIFFDLPSTETQAIRDVLVTGALLEEQITETPAAGDFWEPANLAYKIQTIKDFTLVVNTTKTVAMKADAVGKPMYVAFSGDPNTDAQLNFTDTSGNVKQFWFKPNGFGGADAPPIYYMVQDATPTAAEAATLLANKLNAVYGFAVASVASVTATVTYIHAPDLISSVAIANDPGSDLTVGTATEAFIEVRRGGYLSNYMVRITQGATVLKAAVRTAKDTSPAGVTNPMDACVGSLGNTGALETETTCQGGTNQTTTATKGVWYPNAVANTLLPDINTDQIAQQLAFRNTGATKEYQLGIGPRWLDAGTYGFSPNNMIQVSGSVIRLLSITPIDKIETIDSYAGEGLIATTNNRTRRWTDLPKFCQDGFRVTVTGDPTTEIDNYTAVFNADKPYTFGPGVWREGVAYNAKLRHDPATMPVQFVRKQDNASGTITGTPLKIYFEYGPLKQQTTGASWDDRQVGDDTTNPPPSFVGRAITEIFFAEGRLGFLAEQKLVLSRTNQYFNFWKKSVLRTIATDRIDVDISERNAYSLRHAASYRENILLFTKKTVYFVPFSEAGVNPDNIERNPLFSYENNEIARPVTMDRSVLFACKKAQFSILREIFPSDSGGGIIVPNNVSVAIPAYITGDVLQLTSCASEGTVAVIARGNPERIYFLKMEETGGKRIQTAWWHSDLSAGVAATSVRGVNFVENDLYCLVERTYGTFIEKKRIQDRLVDDNSTWLCSLDRRCTNSTRGIKITPGASTQIDLPYRIEAETAISVGVDGVTIAGNTYVVRRDNGTPFSYTHSTYTSGGQTLSRLTVAQDLTGVALFVGGLIQSTATLRPPLIKDQSAASRVEDYKASFVYENTYTFTIQVINRRTGVVISTETMKADASANVYSHSIGQDPLRLDSGSFPVGLAAPAQEIYLNIIHNDFRPMRLTKVTYAGYGTPEGASVQSS